MNKQTISNDFYNMTKEEKLKYRTQCAKNAIKEYRYKQTLSQEPCNHFDRCHECNKILTCTYYKQKSNTGCWILIQRDKYIDICCSECDNARIKEYAYGYTIDELNLEEIKDLIKKNQMNYCECCGAKMVEEWERSNKE